MNSKEYPFSVYEFQTPPGEYTPIYAWIWNGELTKERIDEQLAEMIRLGIRAFYILPEPQTFRPASMPTHLEPSYLTPAYFQYYKYTLDKARDAGMECWLYDEGGWPSGGACGKVLWKYPEYARRVLRCYSQTYRAGDIYQKSSDDVTVAFIGDKELIEEGHVFIEDTEVMIYDSYQTAWETPGIADYPDITMKDATKAFLEITHEQYKAYLGEHFGKTITAVFTDEPHAPILPFRKELCEMYEEQYGESILPHLPVLAGRVPLTEQNIEIRRRWYDLCSRVFCENYLLECKKWSNANGVQFTGHLGGEDDPHGCMYGSFFHVMRSLRCMDIPGIDTIWRQIYPGEKKDVFVGDVRTGTQAENRFFPRYASSAAAQIGNRFAMTESFGVYGYGLSYEQMRYVLGFQAIRGVTTMNFIAISYAREGYNMSQEAPAFSEIQACHHDLHIFNAYSERLSYVCSRGERICDTALYYPVNDIWGGLHAQAVAEEYEVLGHCMEARGLDFDIVDDDVILQSVDIQNGLISMGNAKYRKIVVPKNAYLSPAVKKCLDVFTVGGGIIVVEADQLVPTFDIVGGNNKIRIMHRTIDGKDFICLFNESVTKEEFAVNIKGQNGYYVDITFGMINRLSVESDGYVKVSLECGESCALYLTDEEFDAKDNAIMNNQIVLDGPFVFHRVNQFVIGERYPEYYEINEEPVPAVLGEWSDMTGHDFSGSGMYETRFSYAGGDAVLDLGDVRYSCEVFLNGRSLGIRVMKPYRYEIPASEFKGNNLLQIRVSNTPGNQHQYTKSFDKYKPWQLAEYKRRQDTFDRDTLNSGLYGPVTLKF